MLLTHTHKEDGKMIPQTTAQETLFSVSASPHVKSKATVSKIMWTVTLALAPAAIFGIYYFGIPALITILVSILSAVAAEYFVQKARGIKVTIADGSAVLTGLLLAMCLPPSLPYYMTAVGAAFSIIIAKHSMGGLGFNIFNPAHIGRAALMVSWPVAMTSWTKLTTSVDAVSTATPLAVLKHQGYASLIELFGSKSELYKALLLGTRNGSIGETCTILLVAGGLFLVWKKIVNWQIPAFMMGTVALLTWVFGPSGLFTGDPILHLMAGGLVIGAFFMATDMVTIPITKKGQILFAIGAGALTALIRLKGGYPEGVCYSILLMNSITPLIDRLVKPKIYGMEG
jgi:electron transport complex protein RnfD